jgi:hypothetical protein
VPWAARHDAVGRGDAAASLETELAQADTLRPDAELHRAAYLAVLQSERREHRTCPQRRFFALVRFDQPLALQSETYHNEVFYGGRSVELTRRAGPMGSCDYLITSRDLQTTEKGQALTAALSPGGVREVADVGQFLVLMSRSD